MNSLNDIQNILKNQSKKGPVSVSSFFKTSAGQYSAHDQFLGITVPFLRTVARTYDRLSFAELEILLASSFNEERLLALFILIIQYRKKYAAPDEIYNFYIDHIDAVNNWNLVDSSAPYIMGAYLLDKPKDILFTFAQNNALWKKRIAIVATWYFIKKGQVTCAIDIAEILLHDTHDLIHKAVGWMLREVGKKEIHILVQFLTEHAHVMPRTMLRYAIEKMEVEMRMYFMSLKKER